eukprot:7063603-Prymnesium_polylepis.1
MACDGVALCRSTTVASTAHACGGGAAARGSEIAGVARGPGAPRGNWNRNELINRPRPRSAGWRPSDVRWRGEKPALPWIASGAKASATDRTAAPASAASRLRRASLSRAAAIARSSRSAL